MATRKKKPVKSIPVKKAKKNANNKTQNISIPQPAMGQESTISVRQITNGFVVRKEQWKRNKYITEETFSKTNPIKLGGSE